MRAIMLGIVRMAPAASLETAGATLPPKRRSGKLLPWGHYGLMIVMFMYPLSCVPA